MTSAAEIKATAPTTRQRLANDSPTTRQRLANDLSDRGTLSLLPCLSTNQSAAFSGGGDRYFPTEWTIEELNLE